MANPHKHLSQWRHNRELISAIPPTHPDWIVTIAFYVALHAVDALLEYDNVSGVHSHDSRNRVLIRTRRYEKIWEHYQPLHDLSRRIRYLADPQLWITIDDIPGKVFGGFLYPVERSVHHLIGLSKTLPPSC
jgi:hypothetical protein